ncbi:hypothetical protein [Bacillus sp. dmp10]|uniref:hypothetical protein n=1 Tax=Bacillus sp. dmp10 TaxID=2293321 RepID=UPI000E2F8C8D|nr:hypothetical protein DZB83_16505 [Bacillus sp. dmp10]
MADMDKYGNRTMSNKYVVFDVDQQKATNLVGFDEYRGTPYDMIDSDGKKADKLLNWPVACRAHPNFNIPLYILVGTLDFYPSKYEFVRSGVVHYHSRKPPRQRLKFNYEKSCGEDRKEMAHNLKYEKLEEYNKIHQRSREPWASSVMGETAKKHADKAIKKNIISIEDGYNVEWHWCHLIAFSMASNQKAQSKGNLVCGTATLNRQMTNVELAVKDFVRTYKRTLLLEVKADIIKDTHIVTRIGYYIKDTYSSGRVHAEYYSPINITDFSDVKDQNTIFQILEEQFIKKLPIK